MGALLASLIPTIIKEVVNGKKDSVGNKLTKGLIASKTANYQHIKVIGGILAIYSSGMPEQVAMILSGILVIDWAIGIYLRIKTNSSV